MEPSRLLLFENGAALGVFPSGGEGDGRGGNGAPRQDFVVVMEPSGVAFTHVHQVGHTHGSPSVRACVILLMLKRT